MTTITELLLFAKEEKALSFADLGKLIKRDEVWVAALFYGQGKASDDEAHIIAEALGLAPEYEKALKKSPCKGLGPVVPTDPLIYRFYEIMQIYGMPLKEIINEKFGDGIMSAIDFSLKVDKEENPKGDRVVVTMNGKFLPYAKW
jgi:cyanate lyase